MNLISAKEAREMANKQLQQANTKELSDVMNQIEKAINYGYFAVSVYHPLMRNTIDKLLELGYECKCHTQYNESSVTIKW